MLSCMLGFASLRSNSLHSVGNVLDCLAHHFHVATKLEGHFLEDLLVEVASCDGFLVVHELDDVTSAWLAHHIGQAATVTIKLLHGREVSIADTDDDDGARQVGELLDDVASSGHVVNDTIGEKQQNRVSSVALH